MLAKEPTALNAGPTRPDAGAVLGRPRPLDRQLVVKHGLEERFDHLVVRGDPERPAYNKDAVGDQAIETTGCWIMMKVG